MVDVETLVSLVFEHPAIWDRRSKLYQNRAVVDQSWVEISKQMDTPEIALRRKWKYLRDHYTVQLNKSSQSPGTSQPSKWHCFGLLTFLNDVVKPRGARNTYTVKDEYGEEITITNNVESSLDTDDVGSSPHPQTESLQCVSTEESPQHSNADLLSTSSSLRTVVSSRKRDNFCRDDTRTDLVVDTTKRRRRSVDVFERSILKEEEEETDDEDLMFFKSLLSHVKNIPNCKKLTFRSEILKLVHDFAYAPTQSSPDSPRIPLELECSSYKE